MELGLITFFLVAVFTALGAAKVFAVPPMRAAAAHLGFSTGAFRAIGSLELAATIGLIAGNAYVLIGIATSFAVVLLMIGAVMAHARAGDGPWHWLPAIGTGALAVCYAVVLVAAA